MLIASWMITAMLAQVPVPVPPFVAAQQEWNLGGIFRLKQERFLRWHPVASLRTGWDVQLAPVWYLELSLVNRLPGVSLAVESTSSTGATGTVGIVRPRLQYQPAGTQTRLGIEFPATTNYSPGTVGVRLLRPRLFVSGRF